MNNVESIADGQELESNFNDFPEQYHVLESGACSLAFAISVPIMIGVLVCVLLVC
jgi:hypothetical protein